MAGTQLFTITVLVLAMAQMYVKALLPRDCSATSNDACNVGECSGTNCYCSPTQLLVTGGCQPMGDKCFKSTHINCGNCVEGHNGAGQCKHDNFNVPFNYAPETDCNAWENAGDCTNGVWESWMKTCCVKSCYQPTNVANINYVEDRCEGLTPQTGTLTRDIEVGVFQGSDCISKCILEKNRNYDQDVVGASYEESGTCWCSVTNTATNTNDASKKYCVFKLPSMC